MECRSLCQLNTTPEQAQRILTPAERITRAVLSNGQYRRQKPHKEAFRRARSNWAGKASAKSLTLLAALVPDQLPLLPSHLLGLVSAVKIALPRTRLHQLLSTIDMARIVSDISGRQAVAPNSPTNIDPFAARAQNEMSQKMYEFGNTGETFGTIRAGTRSPTKR